VEVNLRGAGSGIGIVLVVASKQPNTVIRLAANALVSMLVAWIVSKMFGKRAGIGAAIIGVIAHEVLNKPVANALAELVQ
jgi:uncharacterized membrane protein YvlD (DUF360 family)